MADPDVSLTLRILDGLERVSMALRSDLWEQADANGLYPTQVAILTYLRRHPMTPVRLKDLAEHLGVSGPTATESVNALVRKGMVRKTPHPDDARAVALSVTPAGWQVDSPVEAGMTAAALDQLDPAERARFLQTIIKIIRNLQRAGAIPPQRLCVTCKHFRPFAHNDPVQPHHCEFVNAAFGPPDLRLDCGDHETADPGVQAATWTRMEQGSAGP